MAVKYPNAKQFRQELEKGGLVTGYLFLGEEEGEKDKFISRIIAMALTDQNDQAYAAGRFHVENDEFASAADFALSPSMFSSRRVCVMYNINGLQAGKYGAAFNDMMANLPDSTILIMTSLEIRPPAFISTEAIARLKIVQFWRYFDSDIRNYILMSLKRLGFAIDERAIELLIERTGNDIKKIDDAVDMIRFSGETGVVGAETIKDCVDDLRDTSIFEFVDLLFKMDRRSLTLLKKIYEDGTPDLKILYMILRQAEMIEHYYLLIDGGMSAEEAVSQAGVYSKNRDNFHRYTQKFPRDKLKKVFPLISSADNQLKSGGKPAELIANPVFNMAAGMVFNI